MITVLISTTSQLGDLFISLLKRKAKVKDTSDILPGHGGFLDRVDGIIFALPMGIFYLIYFDMKRIVIFGSTGSIGESLLNLVKNDKKNFNVELISANRNYKKLLKQAKYFNVKNLIISDYNSFIKAKKINKNKNINIFNNFTSLKKIFKKKKIDYTMSAISGFYGLKPTLDIIQFTKIIAIANKESIICGWNLIKKKIQKFNTIFIPVDSEHFSIWSLISDIERYKY